MWELLLPFQQIILTYFSLSYYWYLRAMQIKFVFLQLHSQVLVFFALSILQFLSTSSEMQNFPNVHSEQPKIKNKLIHVPLEKQSPLHTCIWVHTCTQREKVKPLGEMRNISLLSSDPITCIRKENSGFLHLLISSYIHLPPHTATTGPVHV